MSEDEVTRALLQAADAARFAPSIHNTQPWRWVVRDCRLELFGVAERQLGEQDPAGHMLLLSCGTRHTLRTLLGGTGHPFLAVHLGTLDPAESTPPKTPRLPAGQVIEVVPAKH